MYLTGWRIGEVLTLEWRQVDFKANTVRLDPGTTKNDEGRTFPFAALPALEMLLRCQRERAETVERAQTRIIPWVFHRRGKPIKDIRGAWETATEAAGLAGRIPHDFRRTAVRNLERAGVPRSVAMKLTGHKTESVYRRYAIVSEADLSAGVAKLAASTRTRLQARARSARWWRSARRVGTRVIRAKHGQSRRAWRAEHASALERQVPDVIGGGRGIRTPKGREARWISSPLPYQLRLALPMVKNRQLRYTILISTGGNSDGVEVRERRPLVRLALSRLS